MQRRTKEPLDFSSHVWMWELDYKESWAPKNWCFWMVVLEKTLESPLDCKEIKPVNPKGNQLWMFIGRTNAEAPILLSSDAKSRLRRDPDAGKDWRREEKGTIEVKIIGWNHWLDGHQFEQTLGDGEGQGSPGVLNSMGSQRVRHNWGTEQQWEGSCLHQVAKVLEFQLQHQSFQWTPRTDLL